MSAPQLAPGTIVAQKYQLGACLGYAGSSATYQAVGSDGREVVLKIFDPGIRQRADIMGAIEQTYAATNALPQDVAVPLLDAGYDAATGAPFSVGERIPFPSLAQLASGQVGGQAGGRPLAPEMVANLLGVLAALLDQAHARKLFHHALKPTNVFVGFSQGYGVRVTDFGAGLARTAVPTPEGYALSAPWLAPEQVQGQVPAGAPADVFAAGLLMFYALTGRPYWLSCQGTPDLGAWQRELVSPRTPPSARALQLGLQLTPAFDGVIGCALSIDPGQRYRSIRELCQAFEGLIGGGEPESQATVAFPPGALGLAHGAQGLGGYPPAPAPMGGYQAAPAPAAGQRAPGQQTLGGPYTPQGALPGGQPPGTQQPLGTAQYPWGGQAQEALAQQAAAQQQQQMPGQPYGQQQVPAAAGSNPAYVSTQTPAVAGAAGAGAGLGETSAGRTLDPVAMQRRASPNRLAPILVALVAVLLLGGAGAAWIVMGKRSRTDAAQAAASASANASAMAAGAASAASGAPEVPAAGTASAAPADTASAAPADTASAAPADSASAAPADSASASAAPADGVEAALSCDPECDEIKVDDVAVDASKPLTLPLGRHVITASKSGYTTITEKLTVKPGPKVERTFKMKEKAAAPANPPPATPAGPPKPCGRFLKRVGCK